MKIVIKRDLKSRIKVESYNQFHDSFMSDIYDKSWNIFKEILNNTENKSLLMQMRIKKDIFRNMKWIMKTG